jgi:hypothetical protein
MGSKTPKPQHLKKGESTTCKFCGNPLQNVRVMSPTGKMKMERRCCVPS